MKKSDHAALLFNEYNCAQSVLTVFAEDLGLKEDNSIKIALAFGGGLAGNKNICGALTGAMMVFGMKCGISENDELQKEKVYSLTNSLFDEFKNKNGTLLCRELLENDTITGDEKKELCTNFVKEVVERAEALISDIDSL
ncbi:MAG: C_GCAxxG_C_C family protein [Candidatus Cloacimonetes bacterium]|nr:C_GCAxxG_C_C family protein [Candidatus Cloacimonadota bacterium]